MPLHEHGLPSQFMRLIRLPYRGLHICLQAASASIFLMLVVSWNFVVLRYFLWVNLSHSVFQVLISSLCLCVSVVLFSSSRLNLWQLTNQTTEAQRHRDKEPPHHPHKIAESHFFLFIHKGKVGDVEKPVSFLVNRISSCNLDPLLEDGAVEDQGVEFSVLSARID